MRASVFFIFVLSTLTFFTHQHCLAATAIFSWIPNSEPDLGGYIIYYGTRSRFYENYIDVGNPALTKGRVYTSVPDLSPDTIYYFSVIAYNSAGKPSGLSHELAFPTPLDDTTNVFPMWSNDFNKDSIQDHLFVGTDGIYALYGSKTGAGEPILVCANFSPAQNWTPQKNIITIEDINNDGWLDIVGFGDNAVRVAYGIDGESFTDSIKIFEQHFGYNHGWRVERHLRMLIDINNDGWLDIVGFGDNAVRVAYGIDGESFTDSIKIFETDFGYNHGWLKKYPRDFVDVNGDGLLDINGWADGVHRVALSVNENLYFDNAIDW